MWGNNGYKLPSNHTDYSLASVHITILEKSVNRMTRGIRSPEGLGEFSVLSNKFSSLLCRGRAATVGLS